MKILKKIRKFFNKSNNVPIGKIKTNQECLFLDKGRIVFEDGVSIGYFPSPYFFGFYSHIEARDKNASIFIDSKTMINNNAVLIAYNANISIGKNCRIGYNFNCINSDFHGLSIENRDSPDAIKSKDIIIEDNVFIGSNVTVLKGVRIGKGAVVAAGSIVTRDVKEQTIVGGNPAVFIKNIEFN